MSAPFHFVFMMMIKMLPQFYWIYEKRQNESSLMQILSTWYNNTMYVHNMCNSWWKFGAACIEEIIL